MTITDARRVTRRVTSFVGFVCLGALSRLAAADVPDRAETLFQDARALMEKSDYAEACPMLEEAYSLDHGAGTLLALALCHEGSGKPATALGEYRESLALAVRANRSDRVMLAESHVQKLEAEVARITVRLPSTTPQGLAFTLDGAPSTRATMIAGAPVDPGKHTVVASAPGFAPWQTDVVVSSAAPGAVVTVDVPALVSTTPRDRPKPPPSSGSRVLGYTLGAIGVAAVGVGSYFGIQAFTAEARSRRDCNGNECSPEGVAYNHDARGDAIVADVTVGAGVATLAAALYFLLRKAPDGVAATGVAAPSIGLWAAGREGGIGVATSW